MAISLDDRELNERIDQLRTGFDGYHSSQLARNSKYLRLFSPQFDKRLGEHDQWSEAILHSDVGKARNSFNITRSVVELWTALEAYPLPQLKWVEEFIPSAIPALDPEEHQRRESTRRAQKLVARALATLREQALLRHHRIGRLEYHYYQSILRKNLFGHSWMQCLPDRRRRRFVYKSASTPPRSTRSGRSPTTTTSRRSWWSRRRAARPLAEKYPKAVEMENDGFHVTESSMYQPTADERYDTDFSWVWVEDFWYLDREWRQPVRDSDEPIESRVINAMRVNGEIVQKAEYPGWLSMPFIPFVNDNMRDRYGFSDAAMVAPIQDSINKMMSLQQDVIQGEARPKWKYRSEGGSGKDITLTDEGVIHLDSDEDIEQLKAVLDTFPTQVHGNQLMEILARATGLNDSVFGRIVASANSGRALATAWRSVAARLVPRLQSDSRSLDLLANFELDIMELYDWDAARDLYNGNRDFAPEFPNQEPRDFMEVTAVAINKKNAGLTDTVAAMEEIGEKSPDEMMERVRADYTDVVLHPEKAQTYQLLAFQEQQMQMQAQQQGMEQARLAAELEAARSTPPGGAPGGGNQGAAGAAATEARTMAAQQAAPGAPPGTPQPTTQAGQPANGTSTQASTLVRNGQLVGNQILQKTNL